MAFPNLNPSGRNHFTGRSARGLYGTSIDFSEARKLLRGIGDEAKRSDTALLGAHQQLAKDLQMFQGQALVDAVSARGRMQRTSDIRKGRMYKAVLSKKNRQVNIDGFTVGFLTDSSKFPLESLYVEGLEEGTSVHQNTMMLGYWITGAGKLVSPVKGGINATGTSEQDEKIGFRGRYGSPVGFKIEKAITGYHFQELGYAKFKNQGDTGQGVLDVYESFFYHHHLDFLATMLARTGGRGRVSHISVDSAFDD